MRGDFHIDFRDSLSLDAATTIAVFYRQSAPIGNNNRAPGRERARAGGLGWQRFST